MNTPARNVLVLSVVALFGCGGRVSSTATVDAAAPDAARADAAVARCPASIPDLGAPCATEGVDCEYGASPSVGCDQLLECSGGVWTSGASELPACQPEQPAACPASRADITPGTTAASECSVAGTCTYADGACGCNGTDASLGYWSCVPSDCPFPRPRIGDSCSVPQRSCEYDRCVYSETCVDGWWQLDLSLCEPSSSLERP